MVHTFYLEFLISFSILVLLLFAAIIVFSLSIRLKAIITSDLLNVSSCLVTYILTFFFVFKFRIFIFIFVRQRAVAQGGQWPCPDVTNSPSNRWQETKYNTTQHTIHKYKTTQHNTTQHNAQIQGLKEQHRTQLAKRSST